MRPTRRLPFLLLLAGVLGLGLAGCGGPRDEGRQFQQTHASGLTLTTVVKRADRKWFIADLVIDNRGSQPITLQRAGGSLTLEAGGQPPSVPTQSTWAWTPFGVVAVANAAAAGPDQVLAPGQRTAFQAKWKHGTTPVPAKNYPWTLRLSGIAVEGAGQADLILTRDASTP